MNKKLSATAAAAALLGGPSAAHAALIDTTGSQAQNIAIGAFGETNTATYGQTFTVGADTSLDSFTFFVDDYVNPDHVDFAGYVMAWNGARATGPVLFSSAGLSTTNNGGAGGFEQFTINTGGLSLASGQQYVAFFSASNFFDGIDGTSTWATTRSNAYADGAFVFNNNGSNFAALTTTDWFLNFECEGCDLSFRMAFSPAAVAVPEPGTLALFGLGLAGLGLARRRRKA